MSEVSGDKVYYTMLEYLELLDTDDGVMLTDMIERMTWLFAGKPFTAGVQIEVVRLGTAIVEVISLGEFKVIGAKMEGRDIMMQLQKIPKFHVKVKKIG